MSIGCVFFVSIVRPASTSRYGRAASGNADTSSVRKWFGTTSASVSNQKADSWVSTLPLSGMPDPST